MSSSPAPFCEGAESNPYEGLAGADVTELKPGLFQTLAAGDEPGTHHMCLWNATPDKMFKLTIDFLNPDMTPGPSGVEAVQPDKLNIVLYPQEGKLVTSGTWKAVKRAFQFGKPDPAWFDKQRAKAEVAVSGELEKVLALFKSKGIDPSKLTSDEGGRVCFQAGIQYVDHVFPPSQSSVCKPHEFQLKVYPWMRPAAYCGDAQPCLYVGTIEPNDIDQGMLGDCYFMCALACLSEFPELVKRCYRAVQRPQNGFYRCALCKDGLWQTVVVDDLLPMNPATNRPVFAKNREEPNELWVSVLEKAYAKAHGSYAAIKAGDPALAVADLVGGPYEKFTNRPEWGDSEAMFKFLMQCDEDDHLMCLGTPGVDLSASSGNSASAAAEKAALAKSYEDVGLCTGHAFSLIRVKQTKQGHRLCMIRNPWGNEMEWNGAWSDDSDCWTQEIKDEVGFYAGDDGTFWMAWADVEKWFTMGSVTYVLPGWSQLRVRCEFKQGVPTHAVRLQVAPGSAKVKAWFGVHQNDARGLPPDHPHRKYLGLLLCVLRKERETGRVTRVASNSPKLAFQTLRDCFCELELEATSGSDDAYYVIAQSFQSEDKPFNMSIVVEDDARITADFVSFDKPEDAIKYNPPTKLPIDRLQTPATASYQLLTERYVIPLDTTGSACNWDLTPTPAQQEMISAVADTAVEVNPEGGSSTAFAVAPGAPVAAPTTATAAAQPPQQQSAVPPPMVSAAPVEAAEPARQRAETKAAVVCPAKMKKAEAPPTSATAATAAPTAAAKVVNKRNVRLARGFLEKYSTGRNAGGLRSLVPSAFNWKKRFFRLWGDGRLCYYEDDQIGEPLDVFTVDKHTTVVPRASTRDHPNASADKEDLCVVFGNQPEGKPSVTLLLRASSGEDRTRWAAALQNLLGEVQQQQ